MSSVCTGNGSKVKGCFSLCSEQVKIRIANHIFEEVKCMPPFGISKIRNRLMRGKDGLLLWALTVE